MLILLPLLPPLAVEAQNYKFPLNKEMSMSANFGEIRGGHFHSGIDLRVGGAPGAEVYAAESGYVARIFVSPTGYGKALYIEHPDGRTSVYAHLDRFAGKIAEYVENYQYSRQRFTVNDYPASKLLSVKKGDVIGFAGNSGSSGGAHLHFEIRETARHAPINPVTTGYFKPKDNIPPTIHKLALFTLDTINDITRPRLLKSLELVKRGQYYEPVAGETVEVCNPVFFAIEADDRQPENTSKHGINVMKAYLNGGRFFGYRIDGFDFSVTKFVNSLIAYDELISSKTVYIKTYVEEGNKLPLYEGVKNNGILSLPDTSPHEALIEVFDDSGNKSSLRFKIRRSASVAVKHQTANSAQFITMLADDDFEYANEEFSFTLEPNSLYSDALFKIETGRRQDAYSNAISVGYKTVPLHKSAKLRIKPLSLPSRLRNHAFVGGLDDKEKKTVYHGGQFDADGFLATSVSTFGTYFISVDTIAPKISVASKSDNYSNRDKLAVSLSDDLSGISSYNCYIDGKWALFEYDPKTQSGFCPLSAKRLGAKGKRRKMKLVVSDKCKNTATFNYSFVY
jgi:hypothetical protein